MAVTLTYSRLRTLDQDDTVLNEVNQTGSAILTDGLNFITERKSLYMEFSVTGGADPQLLLPNSTIYVNFALWMPIGYAYPITSGPPTTGFNYAIPDTEMAEAEEMFFYSNGSFDPDTCKNLKCYFRKMTDTTYSIELEFYNTYDEGGYFNGVSKNNEYRFLSEFWNELNFEDISHSVYQMEKEIRILTYIKNNDEAADPGYSEKFEKTIYQGQSQHFDTAIEVLESEGGDDLTALNIALDTDVVITVPYPSDYFDTWYAKLIRIQNNTALDFIQNYELREMLLDGYGVVYDEILGTYTMSFTIDHDWIEHGETYRIAIVGYGDDGANDLVIGGMSGELEATAVVSYCNTPACFELYTLGFTGTLYDIDNAYTGNELTVSIEERLRSKLLVNYASDRWRNNLTCRFGEIDIGGVGYVASNDIRKYLTYVYFEIYTEYNDTILGGTVKNLLEQKVMQRTGTNTYTGGGITFTFDTVAETLEMQYDFRVRNQSNALALATYLNGATYYPIQDTQYWGGGCLNHKELFIKWRLQFYYHDLPTPFIDNLDFIQKLHCKDYDGHLQIRGLTVPDGEDYQRGIVCEDDETNCFFADLTIDGLDCSPTGDPEDFKLINMIETMPISGNLNEADASAPDIMTQQTHTAIVDQDADFTGGDARFCIDGTQLINGQRYKITAMAKKIK